LPFCHPEHVIVRVGALAAGWQHGLERAVARAACLVGDQDVCLLRWRFDFARTVTNVATALASAVAFLTDANRFGHGI
jgi:hypothetical protein